MTDFIDVPATPHPTKPPPPGNPERPDCTPAEVAAGKVMAVVSYALNYVGVPFFAVPLLVRSDRFSLYHAKQCLMLWLTAVALGVAWKVVTISLAFLTCGLGLIVAVPVLWAIIIALWIVNTVGLVHAVNGRCRPHPLVGTRAERWFSGIKVFTPSTGAPL